MNRATRSLLFGLAGGCAGPADPGSETEATPVLVAAVEAPATGLRDLRCTTTPETSVRSTTWLLDGVETPHTGAVLPATVPKPGERWSCRVLALVGDEVRAAGSEPHTVPTPIGGNVLFVLLDDVGIDRIAGYGAGSRPARTPTSDALAAEGVSFQTVYAAPSCSVSRAQILTGRYGLRTGFRETITDESETFALPDGELTIPEMLTGAADRTWTTAVFGKWHLVDRLVFEDDAITRQGFDVFQGTIANLVGDYYRWEQHWADGTTSQRTGYATSAVVDDAAAFVTTAPEPWLAWVAFHAAHDPIQPPPDALLAEPLQSDAVPEVVDAMIEATDTELGRLLAAMDPSVRARTTIVVLGDNGTSSAAVRPPLDPEHSKVSVYEGGVRVPLVIAGAAVRGPARRSDALVDTVDLFTLVADLAGVPLTGEQALSLPGEPPVSLDGVSLLPLLRDPDAVGERRYLYAAKAHPNGPPPWQHEVSTVRDADWKYVDGPSHPELYRLADETLDEGPDLLAAGGLSAEAEAARARLVQELLRIRTETPYAW